MLKLKYLVIAAILLSINTVKAQESTARESFIIMSSHGYMRTGFEMNGSGHVNTFLYSPSKLWAYGADLSISQGRNKDIGNRIFNISISPSIYLFPLNVTKHQIYLGANVGFGYSNLTKTKYSNNNNSDIFGPLLEKRSTSVAFGATVGYNYKFRKNWMIGPRVYYDYNYMSSIMALISIGVRF